MATPPLFRHRLADFLARGLATVCLVLCVATGQASRAESDAFDSIESRVKAAYLYKFGSYVDWPQEAFPAAQAPLQIGVLDDGALADELSRMVQGRSVAGRPLQIRRLRPGDSLAGLNVLFVGKSHNARLADILSVAKALPILTVTEADNALSLGGIINFVPVEGKLRFEVSPRTAQLSHLSISARLLAAAYKVESGATP